MSYAEDNTAWFHGNLSREDAVNILLHYGKKEGFFLVRESSGVPGDFVLTLWGKNQALHFQIKSRGDVYFSIDDGPVFQGLDTLIEHYRTNANGLPIRLTEFFPGNPPPLSSRKHGVYTALHQACQDGKVNLVRKLINEGFKDVNVRNEYGGTPLHTASAMGFDDVVLVLLKQGADVNSRDNNGFTPLQHSCLGGYASTCNILIRQGNADVQARCPASGFVSMHEAAVKGLDNCVKCLIENGAPLHPRSLEGDTPRDLALRLGQMHIVDLIDNYPTPPPRFPPKMWLHEDVDRKGAVSLIQRWGLADGLFLVRLSTRDHGYYALSLGLNNQIFHYQIRSRCDRYFYIDDGPLFETLPHLIDHYSKKADGLPILLKRAIPPGGSPPIHLQTASPQTQRVQPAPRPGTPPLLASKSTPSLFHPSTSPKKGLFRRHESVENCLDGSTLPSNSRRKTPPPPRLTRSMSEQQPPQKGALPPLPVPQEPDMNDFIDGTPLSPAPAPGRPPPRGVRRPPPPIPAPTPSPPAVSPASPAQREDLGAAASTPKLASPGQQTLITKESLEQGPELGQGEFGSVLKGTWTDPKGAKVPVALKTLHPEKIAHGEQEFLREARIMFGLDHPCIVRLIGVCLGPPLILVQELVPMGALLDFLIDHDAEISQRDLKLWAAQIAWGMTYLEKRRFVHRDLATRNILMSTKHQMKISDFGLSRAVGSGSDYYKASHGGRWPVKWYAPESINYGTFSHKSDVWSYGVTLWEMYSFGQLPYGDMTGAEVIRMLETEGKRLESPQGCPEHTFSLMLQCWDLNPEKRPTFAELHNIFSTNPLYSDVKLPLKDKPNS